MVDGEDTKQDLIIHLIKLVNNMPIDNKNLFEDKNIVGYIAKSIRNEYIKLSKKRNKININEMELSLQIEISHEDSEPEFEILDMFKVLTKKEAYIMKLLYVYYLSVNEIADYMKISRQAVNQSKNRALKKIKELYLMNS
ncbi:MAG: sigma-70 family RNA polymerase sigma factor [Clostridium sartagoforme]|nr:sigma-70 family RNA polymerase sigma factor [Clostridium sartagoforme]